MSINEDDLGSDLEDMANLADAEINSPAQSHHPYITIDNKEVFKASILCMYLNPLTPLGPGSLNGLKCVRGYTRFETMATHPNLEDDYSITGPGLLVNDPALTFIRVGDNMFLAIVQVSSIKKGGHSMPNIALESLHEPNVEVTCQLLPLMPHESMESNPVDWVCTPSPLKFGSNHTVTTVTGSLIELINPLTSLSGNNLPEFHFHTNELLALMRLLHECAVASSAANIPSMPATNEFPYWNQGMSSISVMHPWGC